MAVIEALPKVQMIKNYSNSFVVEFDKHCILIDAGMDKKAKEILEAIEKVGKNPKAVLITHGHLDHINGLAKLKEEYPDLVVVSSEEDKNAVEGKEILLPKGFKGFLYKFLSVFMKYKGVKVDKNLRDGEIFEKIKAIETSGHTKGSLSFLLRTDNKNILFAGDLVINKENKLSLAPEEFNFDKNQIFKSLKKISEIRLDCMLPGHGEAVKEKVNEKIRDLFSP
ncbi:MAG: MBL fold metallo-hydrolase [Candidatus Aenigmarchaeota archaeon]|nr:MBL fold metallo-hydrolase [Candidatus Aenigmarchaeota archaeon]